MSQISLKIFIFMPIIPIVARRRGDQLTTAGKPSTWFPAGRLVEQRPIILLLFPNVAFDSINVIPGL